MRDQENVFLARYTEHLIEGDRKQAESVIEEAIKARVPINSVYTQILTEAQRKIGELWHGGELGIAEEHRATQITLDIMRHLRNMAPPRPSLRRRVLVTSLAGDNHMIGAKMIADFFHMDGWTVDFLGTDTPNEALIEFCKKREPHLIAVSVTLDGLLETLSQMVSTLRKLPHEPLVMIGGAALRNAKTTYGAHGIAQSAEEAVRVARELMKLSEVKTSLPDYLAALGDRIQGVRKIRGLSQKELGEAASLDRAYISSLENGKQNVTIGALIKIADALQVPLNNILVEDSAA